MCKISKGVIKSIILNLLKDICNLVIPLIIIYYSIGYSIFEYSFNTMHKVVTKVERLTRIQNEASTSI
jgi:hypothetical protein